MKQLIDLYWSLQTFINGHEFASIPLDILAHITVAAVITILLLKCKFRPVTVLLIVLFIAILKESIDWQFQVKISLEESLKDVSVTMIYPLLAYFIHRRQKAQS